MNPRPWLVDVLGRTIRVRAADEVAARDAVLALVGAANPLAHLDVGVTAADQSDGLPLGVLLADPVTDPSIYHDLGEFGKWATDSRSAFHESLAWTVARHPAAQQWTTPVRSPKAAETIAAWLNGPVAAVAMRQDGLNVRGAVGEVLEGPDGLAVALKLALPFLADSWFVTGEEKRAFAVKRDGRIVAFIAPVDPRAVREARQVAKEDRVQSRFTNAGEESR